MPRKTSREIICKCCGKPGRLGGFDWIQSCYRRWLHHGRPADGPPLPGSRRKPRSDRGKLKPTCLRGHPRAGLRPGATCPACARENRGPAQARRWARRRTQFARKHCGHDVRWRSDGVPRCHTCLSATWRDRCYVSVIADRPVDDTAVLRAVAGDPPSTLTPTERDLAAVHLRRAGHTYGAIAERLGCSEATARDAVCRRLGPTSRGRPPRAVPSLARVDPATASRAIARVRAHHPDTLEAPMLLQVLGLEPSGQHPPAPHVLRINDVTGTRPVLIAQR